MSKFKVGDIVKGTSKTHYRIANTKMIAGKVLAVMDDREITVKVIKHKDPEYIGSHFDVMEEYFELVDPVEEAEKDESDEMRKLNKIVKKFKKLVLKHGLVDCSKISCSDCPLGEEVLGVYTICNVFQSTFKNIPLVGDEDE